MEDYHKLNDPNNKIYIKIPAKSRKQEFALLHLINNVDNNLSEMEKKFENPYLTLKKDSTALIYIPFKHAIKAKELDNLQIDQLRKNDYKIYEYGHSYRDRSKNPAVFTIHNDNKELFDALKYTQDEEVYFNVDKITKALKKFVKSKEFKKVNNDPLKLRKFLHTLANDVYKKLYNQNDLENILNILRQHIKNLDSQYSTAYDEINQNPGLRNRTEPFGKYLKLFQNDEIANSNNSKKNDKNLANQMLSMMASDFEPSHKVGLPLAGNLISQVYTPYLIDAAGDDSDNVVIFNPIEGIWTHSKNTFRSLLAAIRPYSTKADLNTMIDNFGAEARNKNAFITPYYNSRYLIFKNCVLDVKTMKTHKLNSEMTKNLHFTQRHQISINYDPNVVDAPEFPGARKDDGGTWDPWTFLMAYAGNDKRKLRFLFFCLSLGLFSGHNFGINISFKGESRWGKTTLETIFEGLFSKRVFLDLYDKLNEQFGFNNYKLSNSLIWLKECNDEKAPLNNDYGVPTYDSLADNQISLRIKGKGDLSLSNPPQLYIDGTSFIRAKNLDTGPAGRTLVYKFPMDNDPNISVSKLTKQAYANGINDLLKDEAVLQYLVNCMIEAYKTCLKINDNEKNKLWSLKLNLGDRSKDLLSLPEFARNWRNEMSKTQGGDIQSWFEYEFLPYISKDKKHPTKMHDSIAYSFYCEDYQTKYSRSDPNSQFRLSINNFNRQFTKLLKQYNFDKSDVREPNGRKARQSNSSINDLNINLNKFTQDGHNIPDEFEDKNINNKFINSYPLGRRSPGWYKLIYKETSKN